MGHQIVRRVQDLLAYPINIMNSAGQVVGTEDSDLSGCIDPVAVEVLREGGVQEVNLRAVDRGSGMEPGVHLPLMVQGEVIGVVSIVGNPANVWHYGELVKTLVELLLEQALRLEQAGAERRLHEGLLTEMVRIQDHPPADLIRRARLAGQELTSPRLWAVVLSRSEALLPHQADQVANLITSHALQAGLGKGQILVGVLSPGEVVASLGDPQRGNAVSLERFARKVLTATAEACAGRNGIGLVAGISRLRSGDFSHSYAEAQSAAQVARKFREGAGVFHISELATGGVIPFVNPKTRAGLVEQILGRVLQHRSHKEIIETTYVYLQENGSIRTASARLHLHRNTVQYRVNQFSRLSGCDLSTFEGAVLCWLTLLAYRFDGDCTAGTNTEAKTR